MKTIIFKRKPENQRRFDANLSTKENGETVNNSIYVTRGNCKKCLIHYRSNPIAFQ